ncbi:MAG: phosphate signaling complex protein PhoU [Ardenticatenaceae bacterium]|nr:phosphate signaling complex protein PhoU [Anaerolineales bacterium]MCB8984810.1 phosphate signaling complex protein PhoU [Ardenticatenaceae bacterium]
MTIQQRAVLERELNDLREDILRLGSLVETAIDQSFNALSQRDVRLAQEVIAGDQEVNALRYKVELESLRILATQQPLAIDLRVVIAGIHMAVELERIGDHAAGIAKLVSRLEGEEEIDTLFKLPKMAKRASQMIEQSVRAYIERDAGLAYDVMRRDDKLDKHYRKLFLGALQQMQDDPDYVRRATFLLWIGHNLERMGDRAINMAERVIFMVTNEFVENLDDVDDDMDDLDD